MSNIRVDLIEYMGQDYTAVARAARTSFGKSESEYTDGQNIKLTEYLAKHAHWTPFCCLQATLQLEMPLAIHAQYTKHQIGGTTNTMSRRYVRDDLEFYTPTFRYAPEKSIKQGSGHVMEDQNRAVAVHHEAMLSALSAYNKLLELGVAPEQARGVLPVDTMTKCVTTGSIVFWSRMYRQRTDAHAQREWDSITSKMDEIFTKIWPISWSLLIGREI